VGAFAARGTGSAATVATSNAIALPVSLILSVCPALDARVIADADRSKRKRGSKEYRGEVQVR
jgi:hypothetical protein